MKNRIEQLLDDVIGRLDATVDRAFERHGFNHRSLKFDDQLVRKTQANRQRPPESSIPMWGDQEVPPCPVCGVIPHNWAIHDEWRRLPAAKSPDKVAADREAYREVYPAHECVDRPTLPCPACLKWTGDGFASVKPDDKSETAIEPEAEGTFSITSVMGAISKT